MSKREKDYIYNLHKDFSGMLDRFINTESVDWENKEPILNDMKLMIDNCIKELCNKDFE